jgi:uncharacterized protein YkwD
VGLRARVSAIAGLCAVAAAIASGAGTAAVAESAAPTVATNAFERSVLAELNSVRRAHGLVPLRASNPLAAAADSHTRAMGRHGFFAHESRDGSSFADRVRRYYRPLGGLWSVGENLLWSTRGIDAKRAVSLWMQSPGHRQNILTPQWREIGLAAVTVHGAPGVYGGMDVVIVTTDFGVR